MSQISLIGSPGLAVSRVLASFPQHDLEVEGSMLHRGLQGDNSLAATHLVTVPGGHESRGVHLRVTPSGYRGLTGCVLVKSCQ